MKFGDPMSPLQISILKLLSQGSSGSEVRRELGIVEGTFKYHLQKIQNKLGTRNRVHSVAEALRKGIID